MSIKKKRKRAFESVPINRLLGIFIFQVLSTQMVSVTVLRLVRRVSGRRSR